MQKALALQTAAERQAEMSKVISELEDRVRARESQLDDQQRMFDVRMARLQSENEIRLEQQRKRDSAKARYKLVMERRRSDMGIVAEKDKLREMEAIINMWKERVHATEMDVKEANRESDTLKVTNYFSSR